jgi:dTDP-glucose 4,6-dehydratase
VSFEEGLSKTVEWYLANTKWVDAIISGEYQRWVEKNYEGR